MIERRRLREREREKEREGKTERETTDQKEHGERAKREYVRESRLLPEKKSHQ